MAEWRFRFEDDDKALIAANEAEIKAGGESKELLPVLFCTPTMELGIDISALNAVYLRNVPPTPANYAQRAGRGWAIRQAAAIFTYCAAQSPHDQYFFERRIDMVAGAVRPPALDLTNQTLVASHLQAVWLAAAKLALSPDIPEILDLQKAMYPLKDEILQAIRAPGLTEIACGPMRRILDHILLSLNGAPPTWLDVPAGYVNEVAAHAPGGIRSRVRPLAGAVPLRPHTTDRGQPPIAGSGAVPRRQAQDQGRADASPGSVGYP